jgi:hypothetical protein
MTYIREDDRTAAEKLTHRLGVVARDRFMTGWGLATRGYSRCAWAVAPGASVERLYDWVKSRSDMQYVAIVCDLNQYRPPRGTAHFHIYTCERDHPSQANWRFAESCPDVSAQA